MPKKIFYSQLTGQPLENAVVLGGIIMDKSEAEDIKFLTDPVIDPNKKKVVSRDQIKTTFNNISPISLNDLKDKKAIPANFLQPLLDTAYKISGWPKPSVVREQKSMTPASSSSSSRAPSAPAAELSDPVIRKAVNAVFGTDTSVDKGVIKVSNTPENRRLAELLARYSMVNSATPTGDKVVLTGLNYDKVMQEAEYAREFIINMRRVLMSKPQELVYTDEVKAQQELIFTLGFLERPFMYNNKVNNGASLKDALEILKTFSTLQMISTARLFHATDWVMADKAALVWHKFIAEDENHNTINEYSADFDKQYRIYINAYKLNYDDTLLYNGEMARLILKEIIKLSQKWPGLEPRFAVGSGWSSALREQHALVESLGKMEESLEESLLQKVQSEDANYFATIHGYHERAKLYVDTVKAIFEVSRKALSSDDRFPISSMTPEEKKWHELFASSIKTKEIASAFPAVMNAAKKPSALPSKDLTLLVGPFAALEKKLDSGEIARHTYCQLSKQPTRNAVVFQDGYIYDKDVLESYLQYSSSSPVTGEVFQDRSYQAVQLFLSEVEFRDTPPPYPGMQTSAEYMQKPASPLSSSSSSVSVENNYEAIKGLIPFEGAAVKREGTITLTPDKHQNNGYTGIYTTFKYKNEELSWSKFVEALQKDLEYLKSQGVIQSYKFKPESAAQLDVCILGFNQNMLAQKGADAKALLVAVKESTEDKYFERSFFSSGPRPGMTIKQDSGTLPDNVFYQRRMIVGDSSRLSRAAKNQLDSNGVQDDRHHYEYLAAARDVVQFGYQGAKSSSTFSLISSSSYLDKWNDIFKSNIEVEYTKQNRYKTEKYLPYDFNEMATKVRVWKQEREAALKPAEANPVVN